MKHALQFKPQYKAYSHIYSHTCLRDDVVHHAYKQYAISPYSALLAKYCAILLVRTALPALCCMIGPFDSYATCQVRLHKQIMPLTEWAVALCEHLTNRSFLAIGHMMGPSCTHAALPKEGLIAIPASEKYLTCHRTYVVVGYMIGLFPHI